VIAHGVVEKRGLLRQQFLKRRPDPQGHGSLLPSFSISSVSPRRTLRRPRFTCDSEG
jgi:hypothetical protein